MRQASPPAHFTECVHNVLYIWVQDETAEEPMGGRSVAEARAVSLPGRSKAVYQETAGRLARTGSIRQQGRCSYDFVTHFFFVELACSTDLLLYTRTF
jgi:hypothetical protein